METGKQLSDSATVEATDEQVSSNLDGEQVILNLDNGVYYGLNPVGSRIWELVQEPITVQDITQTILGEYEVEEERCREDVLSLLGDLYENDLIRIK